MDTETVNSVGFVMNELLGLVGGLILCYFGYRLLIRRLKTRPNEIRGTRNSAKRLIKNAAPGASFALVGAVAICLTASNALRPKSLASKNLVDLSTLPPKEGPATKPDENADALATASVTPMPTMNQAPPGNVAEADARIDQSPAPTPAATPVAETGQSADHDALAQNSPRPEAEPAESSPKTADGERPKIGRKDLERERRAAERKRSRLEKMYQSHLISSEAYKKGEELYKSEIERYRSAMNASRGVAE
jgi:hypothetical protein